LEGWFGKSQYEIILQTSKFRSPQDPVGTKASSSTLRIIHFKNLSIVSYCEVKEDKKKLTKHCVSGAGQITFFRKQIKVKTYSLGPDRY